MSDKKNRIVIGDDKEIYTKQNKENLAKEKAKARLKKIADEKNAGRVVVLENSDAKDAVKRVRQDIERRKRQEIERLRNDGEKDKKVYVIGEENTKEEKDNKKNSDVAVKMALKNREDIKSI